MLPATVTYPTTWNRPGVMTKGMANPPPMLADPTTTCDDRSFTFKPFKKADRKVVRSISRWSLVASRFVRSASDFP